MQRHKIKSIDNHFGAFMARLAGEEWQWVAPLASMVSMATRAGHSCLDFRGWAAAGDLFIDEEDGQVSLPGNWSSELAGCPVIGGGEDTTPLVLENERLYLRRYWQYENDVAAYVTAKSREPDREIDLARLEQGVARLFTGGRGSIDWQMLAALAVLLRSFVVITGGPGTGKTTTLVRIIALLLEQQPVGHSLRIALAAPTGKGVTRLQAVMADIKKGLDCHENVREMIPTGAMTLHRLLGPIKGSPFFRFHEKNRLPYDLVVVDEASMVDLPLMAKLIRALGSGARLVLLGDHRQLASVEPGAVLGDFCEPGMIGSFSREFCQKVSAFVGSTELSLQDEARGKLADSLVGLKDSYRFNEGSGIGQLSRTLQDGDSGAALDILQSGRHPDVGWCEVGNKKDLTVLLSERLAGDPPDWLVDSSPLDALSGMAHSQILCAVRAGPFGVATVNEFIRSALGDYSGRSSNYGVNYHGQPIMVVKNDHEQKLYNGDTGIIMAAQEEGGRLFAFFPDWEKGLRRIPLSVLPDHETVYAMTVHKSQGSEFDKVIIILPDRPSPVLTRELLYTALTRAREGVEVWGTAEIFKRAVEVSISRHSGLRDKLLSGVSSA